MKILWLTDIHLNFLTENDFDLFCDKILNLSPDAILIGGDIAEAPTLIHFLKT